MGAQPAEGQVGRGRPSGALALALALAAAASAWNALAAPFGLGLALAGLALAGLARRRGAGRRATAALAISGIALVGSLALLFRSAGRLGGAPEGAVVEARTPAETDAALRDLAGRTAAERGRAREELSRVEGEEPSRTRPRGGGRERRQGP